MIKFIASRQSRKPTILPKVFPHVYSYTLPKNIGMVDCLDISCVDLEELRRYYLHQCKVQQPFRVSIGKSKWIWYDEFNPKYNLREILDNEIVIEFDTDNKRLANWATYLTAVSLVMHKIKFEVWDHKGKCPHIHIRNLPISHLNKEQRKKFKEFFIRKVTPDMFHNIVDLSLCGIHLVAMEWCEHWKGKYSTKVLLEEFDNEPKFSPQISFCKKCCHDFKDLELKECPNCNSKDLEICYEGVGLE